MTLPATQPGVGVPVTDESGRLVGILTNRDLRFCTSNDQRISELMTSEKLVTVPEGTTLDGALMTPPLNRPPRPIMVLVFADEQRYRDFPIRLGRLQAKI